MKTVIDTRENINSFASMLVSELVKQKPDAAIAFSAGETQAGIFGALRESGVDFTGVHAFLTCEYIGADSEKSCLHQLRNELFEPLGIKNVHLPDENAPDMYEEEIKSCGGLDLAVLGIGLNGHIGFNEPATPFDSYTRIAQLTDSTKRMKADHFGGFENVPSHAVTMGLKTICNAKNVLLTAFGEEKSEIVHKLVYGKTLTYVPAAMLQMHMNMTLCLDHSAASKLD